MSEKQSPRIAITGATGYVGGRLLSRWEADQVPVRCLARRPQNLRPRVADTTEVVEADVLESDDLAESLSGIETAYYLIHSMGSGKDFAEQDRRGAQRFAEAAREAGVRRIIYLGGLGHSDEELSKHLASRQETGRILKESGAQVIEFRASIVIGSGSLSFELVRALVEKLPVMICPRWVDTPAQPISIEDVLDYLVAADKLPPGDSQIVEIGGPDQVSYRRIMEEYASQRGLHRVMIPVPMLSPKLSSLWLAFVTPLYAGVGRELIEGVRNPTVVRDDAASQLFDISPRPLDVAIARALRNEDRDYAETRWSDALSSSGRSKKYGGVQYGSRFVDARSIEVPVPPEQAFVPIESIGGQTGWYYGEWLWRLRGWMDKMVGGVGLRRGRRHPTKLRPGDPLDFWRVEQIEPNRRLRLFAEMKLPGRAWLEFEVQPLEGGKSRICQTAVFDPVGLFGRLYWYSVYVLHEFVFGGMLRGIARAAVGLGKGAEVEIGVKPEECGVGSEK